MIRFLRRARRPAEPLTVCKSCGFVRTTGRRSRCAVCDLFAARDREARQ